MNTVNRPIPASENAIGVFDSGLGGLSVLREIQRTLPGEKLIYVADSAYAPYGDKSDSVITDRVQKIGDFMLRQGVKMIVVACNTATAAAVDALRQKVNIPVVAMEPAVKPGISVSRNNKVGVLATQHTADSRRLASLIERYAKGCDVYTQACPGLVECIEAGSFDSAELNNLLEGYIHPLMEKGIDTLVLGCTHYPLVMDAIRKVIGDEINVIDPVHAVVRQVREQLRVVDGLSARAKGAIHCYTTGQPPHVEKGFRLILPSAKPDSVDI